VIESYNYGTSIVTPTDLQATQSTVRQGRGYGRGGRFGNRAFFTNQDRSAALDWYESSRRVSSRLQVGMALDQELRMHSDPAPSELVNRLTKVPVGSRYVMIGDNLVVVDSREMIQDVIRLGPQR
jgi:hypothetical protein